MKKIVINVHSIIDVITNSSTSVFIHRNCVKEVKELVREILNLSGLKNTTPDDVFYYGVFCDEDYYLDYINDEEHEDELYQDDEKYVRVTANYDTPEYKKQSKEQDEWFNNLKLSIMKGERKKPDWFESAETNYDDFQYGTYIELIPKDDKYKELAKKIENVFSGISADATYC